MVMVMRDIRVYTLMESHNTATRLVLFLPCVVEIRKHPKENVADFKDESSWVRAAVFLRQFEFKIKEKPQV